MDRTIQELEDELRIAIKYCKKATELGMLSEWMPYYTQGIMQGMDPSKAAWEASFEWDLFTQPYKIPPIPKEE
ncbi:MAG: hypothetical protein MN733_13795 [Nitrososphaera sp.]|nr:hypothetical protein [Nitrososphaera sp.]